MIGLSEQIYLLHKLKFWKRAKEKEGTKTQQWIELLSNLHTLIWKVVLPFTSSIPSSFLSCSLNLWRKPLKFSHPSFSPIIPILNLTSVLEQVQFDIKTIDSYFIFFPFPQAVIYLPTFSLFSKSLLLLYKHFTSFLLIIVRLIGSQV